LLRAPEYERDFQSIMNHESPSNEKRGICGICSAGCWIVAEYDDCGTLKNIRPDDSSEMGIICKIAQHAPEIVYSENRLRHPLRRTGKKGGYDFERISWDTAYDAIVENFRRIKKESGPEATAIYTGVGTFEQAYCDVMQPASVRVSSASSVLFPFGSPNTMGVGALCYVAYGKIAPQVTFGKMLIDMFNDIENSDLIVVWGTNPATDLPPIDMKRILRASRRGAEVVVIDPRRTMTAVETNAEWIPVRPGTDGALALALCQVLIEEELYDEDFVRNWTVGFEPFAKYVQHYRPEVAESITGIKAETIRAFGRRLARAHGASQLMYTGMEYSHTGVQGIRATLVLWALAGQLDVPGGRCFVMNDNNFQLNRGGLVDSPPAERRIGRNRFPVYELYRDEAHAIDLPESVLNGNPYRVRSLIIQGSSMLTSWPNTDLWEKTLGALDFLVTIDRQLTADAAYADIVLPAATYFEIESYMTYGSLFRIRERLIPPVGEARGDLFIMAELARRLGYGHLYPQNEKELFEYVLEGTGYTYPEVVAAGGTVSTETSLLQYKKWEKGLLREDGKPGFDTPSGKFEIASAILEEYGYDPLPVYTEPKEGPLSRPDLSRRFPLVFNSGARIRTSFHTQYHGIKSLNRERPEPAVTMNSEDALARGIADGELVRITTPRGSQTMRALVTDNIAQGFIDANHACGTPTGIGDWQKINVNRLTDMNQFDPISGFPVYKSLLCQVEKAGGNSDLLQMGICEARASDFSVEAAGEVFIPVYLDHNGTTPMDGKVREAVYQALEVYGNPSSLHSEGIQAKKIMDASRRQVALSLSTAARRIVFTGGGSEANNLAIKGVAFTGPPEKNHIITSLIEHPAVLATCGWLGKRGFDITYLPVDRAGRVDPESLDAALTKQTCLVSIMYANNETGVIQPIKELAALCRARGVLFHCDGVQALGKMDVSVEDLGVDLFSVSAHKIYGPKGVGALYVKKGVALESLVHGGGQEHGLRSGTENLAGIAGFGQACRGLPEAVSRMPDIERRRDRLEEGIRELIPGARLNGPRTGRLANTLNMTFPGFRGESVVVALSRKGVYCSSGSACHAGSPEPSHALLAMGLSETDAHCSLRFSLGAHTGDKDVESALAALRSILNESKSMVHFVPCR
jgi:cysteine desulfurase NifS